MFPNFSSSAVKSGSSAERWVRMTAALPDTSGQRLLKTKLTEYLLVVHCGKTASWKECVWGEMSSASASCPSTYYGPEAACWESQLGPAGTFSDAEPSFNSSCCLAARGVVHVTADVRLTAESCGRAAQLPRVNVWMWHGASPKKVRLCPATPPEQTQVRTKTTLPLLTALVMDDSMFCIFLCLDLRNCSVCCTVYRAPLLIKVSMTANKANTHALGCHGAHTLTHCSPVTCGLSSSLEPGSQVTCFPSCECKVYSYAPERAQIGRRLFSQW